MNLAATKVYDKEERNKNRFQKAVAHNLGQLPGRLKDWRTNPITGKNEWHQFRLPWGKNTRVVVLSIVKTGDQTFSQTMEHSFLELHADLAKQHGLVLCATLPQTFLDILAGSGGSALDLFIILRGASGSYRIPESQCIQVVRDYTNSCFQSSKCLNLKDFALPEFDKQELGRLAAMCSCVSLALAQTRHRPTRVRGDDAPTASSENIGAKYGILSDISLAEIWRIAKLMAACIMQTQASGEPVYRNLDLAHYDCRICAVGSARDNDFCLEDYKVWAGPRKVGAMRPGLYFRHIGEQGDLGCWPVSRIGPSYTERLLDSFKIATNHVHGLGESGPSRHERLGG
jgi:hypothetical protein